MERSMNAVDEIAAPTHLAASLRIGTLTRLVRACERFRRLSREKTNAHIRAAIARGDVDALKKGLEQGADPTVSTRWRRSNAFHVLAHNPTVKTIGVLLEWAIQDLNLDLLRDGLRAPDSTGLSSMHVLQFNM